MGPNRGTVVIEGYVFQITSIRLYGGKMMIECHHEGAVPAFHDVPCTVFGEDGQGICQSWELTITEKELRGATCVTVVLPIVIGTMEIIR